MRLIKMPKYNLNALGDEEFERMCQGLLQQVIGPGVSIFGTGKDGAREATYEGKAPYPSDKDSWDGKWIFQVKFHDTDHIGIDKARKQIIPDLKKELEKITKKYKYKCDNYIFITNVSLTPVFQTGIKDKIDNEVIPLYNDEIKIDVWGAEEVSRFLDEHTGIRTSYSQLLYAGEIIAELLGLVTKEKNDLEQLVKLFCEGCFEQEQYAQLDDAGDVDDKRIELQHIFIDLDLEPSQDCNFPPVKKSKLPHWLKEILDEILDDNERFSALSYLLDDNIRDLVIVGGPGEGKSTLSQYTAQIYRSYLIGRLNELTENTEKFNEVFPRIPFRILLKEYAQWLSNESNSQGLFKYLAHLVSQKSGIDTETSDIKSIIENNASILILDGLDEVPDKELKKAVLDNIRTFVNQVRNTLNGDMRVIATTRPHGYSDEFDTARYLHMNVKKLSTERALSYVNLWTKVREPDHNECERIRETFNICLDDDVVAVLTKTPLQVTILLIIIRARGSPPKQREELFERYMDIIYQREQKKSLQSLKLLRTEQETIYDLHKYIGYLLHRRAESDETAALMDNDEFKDKVTEFISHRNMVGEGEQLLSDKELEAKVQQIITEAQERLVLIESPEEGKIGFDLTTTREFFAASHLVDTSKNSDETDLRFKAISKSPYWRNVALFFAGRVGRTRKGETPSLVDVCRELDTSNTDKFIKRGSKLVMEMIDDKALRTPHTEVGAIRYVLNSIDKNFLINEEFVEKLKNTPQKYENIIHETLKQKLTEVLPDNLEPFIKIYYGLFGIDDLLIDCLKRAAQYNSKEVQLWCLSKSLEYNIKEEWIIDLLEELSESIFNNLHLFSDKIDFSYYDFFSKFSLSNKVKTLLISLIIYQARFNRHLRMKKLKKPSKTHSVSGNNEYCLLFNLLTKLFNLYRQTNLHYYEPEMQIKVQFPVITSPAGKKIIEENKKSMLEFIEFYKAEENPLFAFIVSFYEFLIKPEEFSKYSNYVQKLVELKQYRCYSPSIFSILTLMGLFTDKTDKLNQYSADLSSISNHYHDMKEFKEDIEELNLIINQDRGIKNHPLILDLLINSNFDQEIKKYLNPKILHLLDDWLQERDLSYMILSNPMIRVEKTSEILELVIGLLERWIEDNDITIPNNLIYYEWKPKTIKRLNLGERLIELFDKILDNYDVLRLDQNIFDSIYISLFSAGLINEQTMEKTYKIVKDNPKFLEPIYIFDHSTEMFSILNGLKNLNDNLERMYAASVTRLNNRYVYFEEKETQHTEIWVGDIYWKLAKNKEDIWRAKFLEGMASCNLNWSSYHLEFLEDIKNANEYELGIWNRIIREAGCARINDKKCLNKLILTILESSNEYPESLRYSSLYRLARLIVEIEPVGFDETPLNLPLPNHIFHH